MLDGTYQDLMAIKTGSYNLLTLVSTTKYSTKLLVGFSTSWYLVVVGPSQFLVGVGAR